MNDIAACLQVAGHEGPHAISLLVHYGEPGFARHGQGHVWRVRTALIDPALDVTLQMAAGARHSKT
ncbi:MAG: hypothetical protein JRJ77_11140 [Deltaproteobacteria bacterium]|nr:hypothetical protein [Deltaproteobacteria bacterium]